MMEDSPSSNRSNDFKTLVSVYSSYFTNRVIGLLSFLGSSMFLENISRLRRQSARARLRSQRPRIPLPFHFNAIDSSPLNTKASRTVHLLEDVVGQIYSNLHDIQKNLQFWLSKAEGTDSQKAYFMLFERGPRALINETVHLVHRRVAEGSHTQHLCHSASSQISERIAILSSLQCCLGTFLAQIYVEVNQPAKEQLNDPDSGLPPLLDTINTLFSKLEASIGGLHAAHQIDSPINSRQSFPPLFERLPEVSQWKDCDVNNAIELVYQNLNKLESYISLMVVKHRRPRRVAQYWIRYTCGAVGLSLCSTWLLKHSSLMGSSDIDRWIREAKGSTISFFKEHVERPLLSIRDELFETFRKRHRGVMDLEEVHLTSNSLHRMLLAFTEEVNGKNVPENSSDQELLEIVMSRYEKELTHPIKSLLGGELARAMLIQVQKLKLDIETAMLELNQILRANEINFAILAALPACFVSFGLLKLLGGWFKKDARAEGIGRISRIQRRLLLVEVEKKIMMYHSLLDKGLETEAQCVLGMLLYSLDCLYQAVETHAKATGEWQCLKLDILELANPDLQASYKLTVTSRLGRMYECLLPSLKRQ